ncbi:MAG: 30S ribosomal protein S17 [Bdellovibrionales bacterium]|nr:30S ribosomal protein S17 [Bdellovibrionales bacterium]
MAEMTNANKERGRKNEVIGRVIGDKMDKTISVEADRMVRHAKYGKFIRRTTVFKAHDEKNEAKVGDKVRILESRPLSKTKRWKLQEILEKARETEAVPS